MHAGIQEAIGVSATLCDSGHMFIVGSIVLAGCVAVMVWIGAVVYRSVGDICECE